jgi:hypothetical protein
MPDLLPLHDAVDGLVHDGDRVAPGGFTHLIPFAAGHEILRQGRVGLDLVRMTPDVLDDQMIGVGGEERAERGLGGRGPTAVVTEFGVLRPTPGSRELTLTEIHPGVSIEQHVTRRVGRWRSRTRCTSPRRRAPTSSTR